MDLDTARLREAVMASDARHAGYVQEARGFLAAHRMASEEGQGGSIRAASLRKSSLFRREYLVLCVDDEVVAARGVDGFVADRSGVGYGHRPAAVFIPASARGRRTTAFRAMLEHEFVHVNQCLLGRSFAEDGADPATEYRTRLTNEFEAYALQHLAWPHLVPEPRLSPVQNAMVQAQEAAITAMLGSLAAMEDGEQHAFRTLTTLRPTALDVLTGLGVVRDEVEWLLRRVQPVAQQIASEVLAEKAPNAAPRVLAAVERWARDAP
ncbi:MAG: hypothetical protein KF729_11520 [Sandaracinaceae bacterium]|nr:hypothetical protein [Sandaracinaceae bacterium]